MKYKVDDKVQIKSIDWYNENKDRIDEVACGNSIFIPDMIKYCDKIVTISSGLPTLKIYRIKEDGGIFNWTDEMIEGLVEEETKNWIDTSIPDGPYTVTYDSPSMNDSMSKNNIHNEIILPKGYIFKDENGNIINAMKIVLEKKKKEYPKTYCECKDILGLWDIDDTERGFYKTDLIDKLQMLLICRDAYWKIAGEEMGLNRPWKPDYDSGVNKYGIICMNGVVQESNPATNWERHLNKVLDFPTEEMRDAFYENFKELIEFCKEFL